MIESLNFGLNGTNMFSLRYKGKVTARSPAGTRRRVAASGRRSIRPKDQRPFQDEAADGWWGGCLVCINVDVDSQRERDARGFFHFFCWGTQCMHEQHNLFKSHYILLFMSSQAEAKIQNHRGFRVEWVYSMWQRLHGLLFASIDLQKMKNFTYMFSSNPAGSTSEITTLQLQFFTAAIINKWSIMLLIIFWTRGL